MVFSSSYSPEAQELITSFVREVDPKVVFEVGTQQGSSACAIMRGMSYSGKLFTCDLFKKTYDNPPYLNTHSDFNTAVKNISEEAAGKYWEVYKGPAKIFWEERNNKDDNGIDLLHIDICNHLDNLGGVLPDLIDKVNKAIILEGGIYNNWQRKYNYKSYRPLLFQLKEEGWTYYTHIFNQHNAVTFLRRV